MKLEEPKTEAGKHLRIFARYRGIAFEVGWQTEMANFFGVHDSAVSTWISKNRIPDDKVVRICEMLLGMKWWESPKLRGKALDLDFLAIDEAAVAKRVMGTPEADFKDDAPDAVGRSKAFLADHLPHTSKDGRVATRQLVYSRIRQGKIPLEWRQPMFDFFQREGEKAGLPNYGYSVFFGENYVPDEEKGEEIMEWDELRKREEYKNMLDIANTSLKGGQEDMARQALVRLGELAKEGDLPSIDKGKESPEKKAKGKK